VISPEDPDWENTYADRPYSYKYGYGAIDAYELIVAAKNWTLLKPQTWFETETIQIGEGTMSDTGKMSGGELIPPGGLQSSIVVTKETLLANNFESLEHVNVRVYIAHSRRGDVEVELISPNGIKSVLAGVRRSDAADTGFPGWVFMTVKHW
jgi:kexin